MTHAKMTKILLLNPQHAHCSYNLNLNTARYRMIKISGKYKKNYRVQQLQ